MLQIHIHTHTIILFGAVLCLAAALILTARGSSTRYAALTTDVPKRYWLWLRQFHTSLLLCLIPFLIWLVRQEPVWLAVLVSITLALLLSLVFDGVENLSNRPIKLGWVCVYGFVLAVMSVLLLDKIEFWRVRVSFLAAILNTAFAIVNAVQVSTVFMSSVSPEYTGGLFSYITFSWFNATIAIGGTKELQVDELPPLPDDDTAQKVWSAFKPSLLTYASRRRPAQSLFYTLFLLVRKVFIAQSLLQLISSAASFASPLAVEVIVRYVSETKDLEGRVPLKVGLCTAALMLGPLVRTVAEGQLRHRGQRLGIRVRSALTAAIYEKALRLNLSSSKQTSGQLTNLFSVDAEAVQSAAAEASMLWATPLEIFICIGLLFRVLGIATIGGVILLILAIPVNFWTVTAVNSLEEQLQEDSDERLNVTTELLNNIRVVKLFAWEKKFLEKVKAARKAEVRTLKKFQWAFVIVDIMWDATPLMVGVFSFLVHTQLLGREMDAATGFASLALLDLLSFPLLVFPFQVLAAVQARVSLNRIQRFLRRDEVSGIGFDDFETQAAGEIVVTNATLSWSMPRGEEEDEDEDEDETSTVIEGPEQEVYTEDSGIESEIDGCIQLSDASSPNRMLYPKSERIIVNDFSMRVQPGQLVCVYGPTGCGKSTLLSGLLGECVVRGQVAMNGRVAYVSQKAWIQSGTVRNNILFGHEMDSVKYQEVVRVCGLTHDLQNLDAGDLTELGERGVNLSGGQQQRLNMARAVYDDADVYLLDDPLSALDAQLAQHLLDHCICGHLRKKTRVLVTHQIKMTLRRADLVVVIDCDGEMVCCCTPRELKEHLRTNPEDFGSFALYLHIPSASQNAEDQFVDIQQNNSDDVLANEGTGLKIIAEEERALGSPSMKVYLWYLSSTGGVLVVAGLVVFTLGIHGGWFAQTFLLGDWIRYMDHGDKERAQLGMVYYVSSIGVYVLLVLARSSLEAVATVRAAKELHSSMIQRIIRAPMHFFDSNPTGRVVNRFSQDLRDIDQEVMYKLMECTDNALSAITVLFVVGVLVPMVVFPMLFTCALMFLVAQYYLTFSRELKRLESVTRSPVFEIFSQTVDGLSVMRAYRVEERFVEECFMRVDAMNRAHLYLWVSNRWLGVRIQALGSIVAGTLGVFLVIFASHMHPAAAGLSLLYALQFTEAIEACINSHAELEMVMNSVERAHEYCVLEQEPPAIIRNKRPPSTWPHAGEVEFECLYLKYPTSRSPVLKNICMKIPAHSHVGIVGRTGAGKSSLIAAMFRLVEPSSGRIIIDGVNILKTGLEDVRSRLAIVPQSPTLFIGSVRSNLDPDGSKGDIAVWQALERVCMREAIMAMPNGLDFEVLENGSNFSVGQRQLLCMARALLRKAKVIVMDEASASVDSETDEVIQETVQRQFKECTVITIAHRLHTIAYCDRVAVMDDGRVIEFDTPHALLHATESVFRTMCEQTGDFEHLLRVAEKHTGRLRVAPGSPGRTRSKRLQ